MKKNNWATVLLLSAGAAVLFQSCGGNNSPSQPANNPPPPPTNTPTVTSTPTQCLNAQGTPCTATLTPTSTATATITNTSTTTATATVTSTPTVTSTAPGAPFSGEIITVAGNGTTSFGGLGGPATLVGIQNPHSVAVDGYGNIYIGDDSQNRILKVDTAGTLTVYAGSGLSAFSGDGGPATQAGLYSPYAITADSVGNLYIADSYHYRVRKVDTSGTITTVAGNGTNAFSGDGGPATSASLSALGLALDSGNNLYIADSGNNRIRKVTGGTITTVAGSGSSSFGGDGGPATLAGFYANGVAVDAAGLIYIADGGNFRIRRVDLSGNISTFAGNGTAAFSGDGGPATLAGIQPNGDMAFDSTGALCFADTGNSRIRRVDSSGNITTIAGGASTFSGDGGPATSAGILQPYKAVFDPNFNMFIADTGYNRIREVFR